MKPRTEIQKRAEQLSATLRPITDRMMQSFAKGAKDCKEKHYFAVLDKAEELSVVRYFNYHLHKSKPTTCTEFMQVWFSKDGYSVRAKQRNGIAMYFDTFFTSSELATRSNKKNLYGNRLTYICYQRLFKRAHNVQRVFCEYSNGNYMLIGDNTIWLTDEIDIQKYPFFETIMKLAPEVAERILNARILTSVSNDMLRIAWKHHYLTKNLDYKMWADAVNMGIHVGLDMHNPIYLCPDNLTAAHDYYQLLCDQQRAKEEREAAIRRKLEDMEARKRYAEFIRNYADLTLTDGILTIKPLQSVEAFEAEGEAMHHCVFACGYYKKADTLILSARINGKRAETIEVNLKDFSIVQSRGKCNQPSEYHRQILALMKEQMYKIERRTIKKAA